MKQDALTHDVPPSSDGQDVDLIPLLPQGVPVFQEIPAQAVILEALAPALKDGVLIVRATSAVGVILVKDSTLFEKYCMSGGHRFFGDVGLKRIKSLEDAHVTAYKLQPDIIDIIPALLRGEPCYDDLRLSWVSWPGLLSDMLSRDGTHIVEIFTPRGRGVTCITDGKQIATYTDRHPTLGEPTLIDGLVRGTEGTIRIRESHQYVDDEPESARTLPDDTDADVLDDDLPVAVTSTTAKKTAPGAEGAEEEEENPFEGIFAIPSDEHEESDPDLVPEDEAVEDVSVKTPDASLEALLPTFKTIAREHLNRSAVRVETLLDTAAKEGRPLAEVFADIRLLSIRGVMQSSLDKVVDEMKAASST